MNLIISDIDIPIGLDSKGEEVEKLLKGKRLFAQYLLAKEKCREKKREYVNKIEESRIAKKEWKKEVKEKKELLKEVRACGDLRKTRVGV